MTGAAHFSTGEQHQRGVDAAKAFLDTLRPLVMTNMEPDGDECRHLLTTATQLVMIAAGQQYPAAAQSILLGVGIGAGVCVGTTCGMANLDPAPAVALLSRGIGNGLMAGMESTSQTRGSA